MPANTQDLSGVLRRWSDGEENLADEALPFVLEDLRQIAARYLQRERPDHTLQATALVNLAYIQLRQRHGARFANRQHFVGHIAHVMRRLLVDHARQHNAYRRGGGWLRVTLAEAEDYGQRPTDLVALDDALLSLDARDPQMSKLVELRYFAGLTLDETAEVLGMSRTSVVVAWRRTKVWLHRALNSAKAC